MSEPTMLIGGGRNRGGRPPRAGVRATRRVEFRCTPDEGTGLEQVSRETGKPIATLIREAVNEFVADYRDGRVFTTPIKPR